ncbi:unnamed protein product [Urochloa humidicola]
MKWPLPTPAPPHAIAGLLLLTFPNPCMDMERILLWEGSEAADPLPHGREICARIKFGHAPKGYLVPGVHVLRLAATPLSRLRQGQAQEPLSQASGYWA